MVFGLTNKEIALVKFQIADVKSVKTLIKNKILISLKYKYYIFLLFLLCTHQLRIILEIVLKLVVQRRQKW